jgi:hypothetical protein
MNQDSLSIVWMAPNPTESLFLTPTVSCLPPATQVPIDASAAKYSDLPRQLFGENCPETYLNKSINKYV